MTKNLLKLGRSHAVVIPASFVKKYGSTVRISTKGRTLLIEPIKATKISLRQLMRDIPAAGLSEVNWGTAKGREEW